MEEAEEAANKRAAGQSFLMPSTHIVSVVAVIIGAIEKLEGIFSSGFFSFLCKKKENKAKAEILKVLDVLPPEILDADETLKSRHIAVRQKIAK